MVIGMTYDLMDDYLKEGFSMEEAAEFDREETISGIESALNELGYGTDRIGNVRRLSGGFPKAEDGIWFSIYAKVCTEWGGRHRFPHFWMRTAYLIPSLTPLSWLSL